MKEKLSVFLCCVSLLCITLCLCVVFVRPYASPTRLKSEAMREHFSCDTSGVTEISLTGWMLLELAGNLLDIAGAFKPGNFF